MLTNYSTHIAGVWHHCKLRDNGSYEGYAIPEDNPYDRNAIAIYTNSGKKVGYIPKDETLAFRFWSNGASKMPCKLFIEINSKYPEQSASSVQFTNPNQLHKSTDKYIGKSVHLSGYFPNIWGVLEALEACGMTIHSRLRMDTDYVIYDDGITDAVKKKQGDEKYHFEVIEAPTLLGEIFYTPTIDYRGKEIAFAHSPIDKLTDMLKSELMFYGATIVPNYKKKTTDIVVIPEKGASYSQAEKSLADGKVVLSEYEMLSTFGNVSVLPDEHSRRVKTGNTYEWKVELTTAPEEGVNHTRNEGQAKKSSSTKNNSGCLSVIILTVLIASALSIIF